jgi:hypothetical protein
VPGPPHQVRWRPADRHTHSQSRPRLRSCLRSCLRSFFLSLLFSLLFSLLLSLFLESLGGWRSRPLRSSSSCCALSLWALWPLGPLTALSVLLNVSTLLSDYSAGSTS